VQRAGRDSAVARIATLVADAQAGKAPISAFADRLSGVFVPIIMVISALTGIAWYVLAYTGTVTPPPDQSPALFAFMFALAVLVVACPCALGLATPTAIMVATGAGAAQGLLIKGGACLEMGARVDCLVTDKTGTLTRGQPTVAAVVFMDDASELMLTEHALGAVPAAIADLLRVNDSLVLKPKYLRSLQHAAAAQRDSEHILGRAVSTFAAQHGASLSGWTITDARAVTGRGTQCQAAAPGEAPAAVCMGNPQWALDNGVVLSKVQTRQVLALEQAGYTVTVLCVAGEAVALVCLCDELRPEAHQLVSECARLGIEVYMCTGDNPRVAGAVAAALGIAPECVRAGLSPGDKLATLQGLQEEGRVVAFVGDGVNDSPALAQSNVGLAVGAGADAALEAADIVLLRDDLRDILNALSLCRQAMRVIKRNFAWALLYNVLAIPAAAGLLWYITGRRMPPEVAAAAMGLSSVSVVLSSLTLQRFRRRYK
jgi:Cu+-exporting ATPase